MWLVSKDGDPLLLLLLGHFVLSHLEVPPPDDPLLRGCLEGGQLQLQGAYM
eukprot:CAMPEP_0168619540 /NCGR_PEP_ID=MMETSP0449_2-20121227/6655_1 /TAXON_ID=1082188 /ORGANISM="Strombidium rassoulzadegani, Strain ras09" /LENGTH=50 /DNA_ID=CAMNT_0008660479 /DNA_START=12 /DNA_END=164 /DNA_ORIENTATION=-